MTTSEVEQELERLLEIARTETQPGQGARQRVRGGVDARLVAANSRQIGLRRWLGLGAGLGLVASALWWGSAPHPSTSAAVTARSSQHLPTLTSSPPVVETARPTAVSTEAVATPEPANTATPAESAATAKPKSAASAGSTALEELELVRAMQQALRSGNASQALSLAADHARRFPSGNLTEEREGVRAIAQCQLALPAQRTALREAFARRFPGSPYAARVQTACR